MSEQAASGHRAITIMQRWIDAIPTTGARLSESEAHQAIAEAAYMFGYTSPFTEEQKAIIHMLFDNRIGRAGCISTWRFYRDLELEQEQTLKECSTSSLMTSLTGKRDI